MDQTKIFVVDDSEAARLILIRLLSEREDYLIVGEASTGQGGIIMLDESNPDILILESDVRGGMKADKIIKELRKISPELKILLCVEQRLVKHAVSHDIYGANDFIEKPYKKNSIYRIIDDLMSKEG